MKTTLLLLLCCFPSLLPAQRERDDAGRSGPPPVHRFEGRQRPLPPRDRMLPPPGAEGPGDRSDRGPDDHRPPPRRPFRMLPPGRALRAGLQPGAEGGRGQRGDRGERPPRAAGLRERLLRARLHRLERRLHRLEQDRPEGRPQRGAGRRGQRPRGHAAPRDGQRRPQPAPPERA